MKNSPVDSIARAVKLDNETMPNMCQSIEPEFENVGHTCFRQRSIDIQYNTADVHRYSRQPRATDFSGRGSIRKLATLIPDLTFPQRYSVHDRRSRIIGFQRESISFDPKVVVSRRPRVALPAIPSPARTGAFRGCTRSVHPVTDGAVKRRSEQTRVNVESAIVTSVRHVCPRRRKRSPGFCCAIVIPDTRGGLLNEDRRKTGPVNLPAERMRCFSVAPSRFLACVGFRAKPFPLSFARQSPLMASAPLIC